MFSVLARIGADAGKLCGLGLILIFTSAGGAAAQSVLSCTGTSSGGCYDFTITDNQQNTGFIQVQVIYTASGAGSNVMNITGIQAVYADRTGVAIPRASTSTDFAPQATNVSLTTGTNAQFDWDDKEIRNLSFSFTGGTFTGTAVVQNFQPPSNFRVQVSDSTVGFNCSNVCEYRPTDSLPGLPIGEAVPEIDGGRLPHVAFLLAGAYLAWRRQRQKRELSAAFQTVGTTRS